jgi:dienelactone hydrolase
LRTYTSTSSIRRALAAVVLSVAVVTGSATAVVPAAHAQATNPFQRGPDPTTASIEATRGPFAVAQVSVANSATPGFGSATIYYPTDTSQGTFGGVAISPGFTGTQSSISWYGPRLASQGFVVITINTNSLFDNPSSRADQLMAALSYLTNTSSVRTRVDRNRLALMGHSMGGGGTLEAATENPSLQAAIPLTGWHTTKNFSGNQVPTLVVGAENDSIAPVGQHSEPFYNSMSATLDKGYLELDGASHLAPTSPNTTIAKYSISWLKRFVDNDPRYEPFLCGAPHQADLTNGTISEYRETCPYS